MTKEFDERRGVEEGPADPLDDVLMGRADTVRAARPHADVHRPPAHAETPHRTPGTPGEPAGNAEIVAAQDGDLTLAPQPMPERESGNGALAGKVAVVTGAASGIGRAIAEGLSRAGAMVAVADLDLTKATEAAAQICERGGKAVGIAMDVSDEEAVDRGFDELAVAFGAVDILVSNAGIQIVDGLDTLPYADWKKVLAIHLDGAFLTTRAALRQMYRANRGGTVIYMGSAHSHLASPLKAPYVTAKHGLLGLARTLAKEGAKHGVRSHVVCPGFVRTPLVEKQIPEQAKALGISEEAVVRDVMLAGTVDATFTTLEDVAQTVLFLCTFPSAALTGQSIMVSHGWYMQ